MAYFDQAKTDLGVDELSAIFTTSSNNDARVQMASLLGPMFGAVGIVYENQLEDSQIFFGDTLDNGTWDLGEWAWVGSPGHAGLELAFDMFDPEQPPLDGFNFYRWGTADSAVIDAATMRYAEIHDEAAATVDEAEIEALIDEAQTLLADNAVFMPLYQRLVVMAYWGDGVAGPKHNISQSGHTWNIEEWYRADR
jgi:ABC-type transport system substrate-binding protein